MQPWVGSQSVANDTSFKFEILNAEIQPMALSLWAIRAATPWLNLP